MTNKSLRLEPIGTENDGESVSFQFVGGKEG